MCCDDGLSLPLRCTEGGERLVVAAAHPLEQAASNVERHPHRGFATRSTEALGLLEPLLGLLEPTLPDIRVGQRHVRGIHDSIIGPAVPSGELDRLHTAVYPERQGLDPADHRPMGQGVGLEEWML